MGEENQGDTDGDEDGAEDEGEADAEEETHGAVAFLRGFFSWEEWKSGLAVAQDGAEVIEIGEHPEFYFVARLPEQVEACADNEEPDDPEKLGHG